MSRRKRSAVAKIGRPKVCDIYYEKKQTWTTMENAQEFLDKQNAQFYFMCSWLKNSMPISFFEQISEEDLFLVARQLVDFQVHDHYCEIFLPKGLIILSTDTKESLVKGCRQFEEHPSVTMHSFISLSFFPGLEKKLCIASLFFGKSPQYVIESRFLDVFSKERQDFFRSKLGKIKESNSSFCELVRPSGWMADYDYSLELSFVCKEGSKKGFLEQFLAIINSYKLKVGNIHLSYVSTNGRQRCLLVACDLQGENGSPCWEVSDIEHLEQELLIMHYFSIGDLFERSYATVHLENRAALYFLKSVSSFVHQLLVHVDPNMYSLENVEEAYSYWPELGVHLFDLFSLKCDPYAIDIDSYNLLRKKFVEAIEKQDTGREYVDIRRKTVFLYGLHFIDACMKTNFFVVDKAAIAYRLDPTILEKLKVQKLFSHQPYGIFFIYQKDFLGFHIRFQDLARGGLRTIALSSKKAAEEEAPFTFLECYKLAWTQQKKNKDIPEGGSKGIIFLHPPEEPENKWESLYQAQKIFVESLLSLVNCNEKGLLKEKAIVDYFKQPEYLYLGPDENMHDHMIEWIAKYSESVGYKPGAAFITSKPKMGINHKQYGVTSHGVNVCMQEVLRFLKIDPFTDRFTVKMAGGPDGDVAGNQICNLLRYYPQTACLLSLIDVSGVIYDPKGLDLKILEELFLETKSIRFYPVEALSEGGFLLDMHSCKHEDVHTVKFLKSRKKEEEIVKEWLSAGDARQILRTFMHRLPTDVFIPAGGRPATLSAYNIHDFLDEKGMPTAKAIVEGANLYLTEEAREILEGKGVIIIKDSSANKGGVICSSFEVLSSLSLNNEEYLANKEQIISQIMQKIEEYARDEVDLILRTYAKTGVFCSQISEKISDRMELFSSQIRTYLEGVKLVKESKDPLTACFFEYLLPLFTEKFGEQMLSSIPDNHKKAIIAVWIASKVVYFRGLEWAPSIVDLLPFLCKDPSITSCRLR